MTVVSKHLASVKPEPKLKMAFSVDVRANHHFKLPQLVAVQSHDVVLEMSMFDVEPEKAVRSGLNTSCVIILIGFPDKLMTAPLAYWTIN